MRLVTVVRRALMGALFAGLCGAVLATAETAPAAPPGARVSSPRVTVSLLAECAEARPGQTLWLGLHFQLAPGWHVYWQNPGDSGYPPLLTWRLPEGVAAGPVTWPVPGRIPVGPLVNFGYEGEVLLTVPVEVPADYAGRRLPVELAAEWLVCEASCIPGEGRFALDLPMGRGDTAALGADGPLFAVQRQRVPAAEVPEGWRLSARVVDGRVALRVDAPQDAPRLRTAAFYPFAEGLMQAAAGQDFRAEPGGYALRLTGADTPVGEWTALSGIFVGQRDDQLAPLAFAFEAPIVGAGPGAIRPASPSGGVSPPAPVVSFWLALGLAFVGGLLLNLMPCVFPVLSIKLLSLLRQETSAGTAGDSGRTAAAGRVARWQHAAGYGAGVVLSFLALAGALLVLRAAGQALGWGFQLQSPAFVGGMAVFFFAFGLSLSGALPIATLAEDVPGAWRLRHPLADAFFSGMLAVLVASPCTAPLMGAALGAAFVLPALETLVIFLVLGLGMALPYALLAAWPAALARLPRPGPWMERLKEALAFPLFATVLWLAWVLVEQVGAGGLLLLGAALLVVALAAWLLGWAGLRTRLAATLFAGALIAALLIELEAREAPHAAPESAGSTPATAWGAWSPAAVAAAHAAGRTVFVDYTAAWCITCQVNKRLV